MNIFSVTKLVRGKLTEVVNLVLYKRETVFIERYGKIVAKIVPTTEEEVKVISDPYLELLDPTRRKKS